MWAWKWAWSAILREIKKIIYKWVLCEENMDRPSLHQGIIPTLHTIYISNQEETERYCSYTQYYCSLHTCQPMYHFGPTNPFLFVLVNKACCKPLYRGSLQVAQLIWHNEQIKETHNGWREPSFNLSPTVVMIYMVHVLF